MEYKIEDRVYNVIRNFYRNVAIYHGNTNSLEDILRYIDRACKSIYQIENGLSRRRPRMKRWQGYYVALSKDNKWYYAYRIEGNVIHVYDACYCNNIHDNRKMIDKIITEAIHDYLRRNIVI